MYSLKKNVCISFDWHNDRHYRYLLGAFSSNSGNPIEFNDLTPGAIDTNDVGRVKAVLSSRIRASTHTLVLIGKHANDYHRDSPSIGERNWIWWEIEASKAAGNKLIAVKIDASNPTPNPLYGFNTSWAYSFTQAAILAAINS